MVIPQDPPYNNSTVDFLYDRKYGIFTYSTDETSTYYADSTVYDGVSYKVFDFDSDMLIWGDEGAYYRME